MSSATLDQPAIGYDYAAQPKRTIESCDLCSAGLPAVPHWTRDRYGFAVKIVECRRCGLIQHAEQLTPAGYAELYERWYRPLVESFSGPRSDAQQEADQEQTARLLLSALPAFFTRLRGKTLLDIGGSRGTVAAALRDKLAMIPTVVDPCQQELHCCAEKGLATWHGTVAELPEHLRWDVAVCLATIEHVPSIREFLADLRRHVNELLIVSVIDTDRAVERCGGWQKFLKIDHPFALHERQAWSYLVRAGFWPLAAQQVDRFRFFVCEVGP